MVNRKTSSVVKAKSDFILPSHASMEDFLGRYCGLMLFVKEIDQNRYQQICAVSVDQVSSTLRLLIDFFRLTLLP